MVPYSASEWSHRLEVPVGTGFWMHECEHLIAQTKCGQHRSGHRNDVVGNEGVFPTRDWLLITTDGRKATAVRARLKRFLEEIVSGHAVPVFGPFNVVRLDLRVASPCALRFLQASSVQFPPGHETQNVIGPALSQKDSM